jgi:SAM-dependent methyltransferase
VAEVRAFPEAEATPVFRDAARCVACGSERLRFVDVAAVEALAEAWAAEQRLRCGAGRGVATWRRAIESTIDGRVVRFDRCEECGCEIASPRRSWTEATYPDDERCPSRWEFHRFLRDLGVTPVSVLELGSGTGTFLSLARARGHRATGIDFSRGAVREARRAGLDVVGGGFDELRRHLIASGRDATFEAIAMFHVIEHLTAPSDLFEELAAFARPGTKLGISCPGPRRFTRLIREEQVNGHDFWDYPPHHVIRWTLGGLRRFLEARGWRVIHASEEPLDWVGAASQIAITRALHRGYVHRRLRKRIGIGHAMLRVLASRRALRGLSLYVLAERARGR